MHTYKTQGTCSSQISFAIDRNIITHCAFTNGCSGNTQGIARLVIGRRVDEVIFMLRGIQCQNGTSCPDQLALALEQFTR